MENRRAQFKANYKPSLSFSRPVSRSTGTLNKDVTITPTSNNSSPQSSHSPVEEQQKKHDPNIDTKLLSGSFKQKQNSIHQNSGQDDEQANFLTPDGRTKMRDFLQSKRSFKDTNLCDQSRPSAKGISSVFQNLIRKVIEKNCTQQSTSRRERKYRI